MLQNLSTSPYKFYFLALLIGIFGSGLIGFLTYNLGIMAPILLIILAVSIVFVVFVMVNPRIGLIGYMIYCFIIIALIRHAPNIPFGPLMEIILILTWISILFNYKKYDWSNLKNEHFYIALAWFIINILEVINPAGASLVGWFNEIRSTSVAWLMVSFSSFLIFNRYKDLNLFIIIIIGMSSLASIYGLKQLYIGVSSGEQEWLDYGAAATHILFGQLRVFSTYSDAGQFGASQAHIGLIALVLALGPYKRWKKILFGTAALLLIYGMLISGTRGAMFALIAGVFTALFLSKKIKILIIGIAISLSILFILKYTSIGNSSYQIVRLRTSLDPEDPSLNERFKNQRILKETLSRMPFGGGVGVSGINGTTFNKDKLLSTIPPDSYWVKVWVMYGVVGLVIWFSMIMFIIGKCCGIVWKTKNKNLQNKLIALTAGTVGIFICSYGNEVINVIPSSMIVYISWCFIFLSPAYDKKLEESIN